MSEKSNKTVYQGLSQLFNSSNFSPDDNNTDNRKIIIKGDSRDDIYRKGLELQQKKDLESKFFKTTDHGFQKAMQYEAARLPAYLDYEGMEYFPLIASALDLLMEESTTIGENGKMLNVYSNKDRIKTHLEELFYDIVNVNVNLPFWTRNMCKYGDNFVHILGEKKKGITHVRQMVNYEVERIERIEKGKPKIKFKNRETADEFNVFEVVHFRLLGDDKYLPYGSSLLNKVRRVFRQLVMAEDAMLTYRLLRAGEKRVFKIDVGNIDDDDIEEYLHKVATRFKKQQQVNPNDGQLDYRFNILGNDEDWFLPVRNSNSQTGIETLPGAQNLDQIQDIEYLRDNLFTGLGIPKPFLGFQDAAGDGKNMAQMDVRFAKKINRIQQAVIQELNKLAIIHLYLLGFDSDDLYNFTLSLTNPSIQQEQLKVELLQTKAQVYTELTRNEGGIAAMSHTEAKKLLFNKSDKEIVEDFKKQRMERAIAQELQDTPLVIKNTGLFNDVDDKYAGGISPAGELGGAEGGEGENVPGETPTGDFPSPNDLPPVESKQTRKPKMNDETYGSIVDKVVYGDEPAPEKTQNKKILKETIDENSKLNTKANQMVDEIDQLLANSVDKKINNNNIKINNNNNKDNDFVDFEDLNLENIQDIETVGQS